MSNETKQSSAARHTPGPWYLADLGRGKIGIQKHEAGIISRIAVCHPEMLADEHGGSATANARLIAAAPDMLEALKEIYALYERAVTSDGEIFLDESKTGEIARAAIAKAEGRKS